MRATLLPAIRQFITLFTLSGLALSPAFAFKELTVAQTWIYDTPHLTNTSSGQTIRYRYSSEVADADTVSDNIVLTVTRQYDDDRRDVSLVFLTDERRLPFPDFTAFRGNPVIIAMLEHIAQDLANRTGGGTLYFRNRIRDGLAGDVTVSKQPATIGSVELPVTVLTFKPFLDDPNIGAEAQYANAEFSVTLSDKVAGSVVAVEVRSATDEEFFFHQKISVDS